MIMPQVLTLAAFARARIRMSRLNTRSKLDAFQKRRIARFLRDQVPRVSAYSQTSFDRLCQAPVMDKAQLMESFASYNRLGLGADRGWRIFDGMEVAPRGYAVGASTGTSGNRGLYVVSDAERYVWLGVMLSRAFPDLLTQRERVAVILPQTSRLYDSANESQRLNLKFFDLGSGVERQIKPVTAYKPTVIVAPPRVLTALAQADTPLAPRQIFSGAEVLDCADRAIIEARFGLCVREIYMASEGLFAISCPFGTPHLVEDHVMFEWEPVEGSRELRTPLITDFTRRTQIMLRYRMNDLIELDDRTCACGSPQLGIRQIVGRQDDAFSLVSRDGKRVTITPDIIRNAVLNSDRSILEYQVTQTAANEIRIELPPAHETLLKGAAAALQALFSEAGLHPHLVSMVRAFGDEGPRKRRRVLVDMKGEAV